MHANLILLFKPALYSSTLVIKLFKSSICSTFVGKRVLSKPAPTVQTTVYNLLSNYELKQLIQ